MITVPSRQRKFLQRLHSVEKAATFLAFLVLIGALFLDVVYREFTGVGLHWARQVGVYANIVVVMLGLGLASAGGAHLRPRFADHWLPKNWEPVLQRLQEGLMALFCLGFGLLALQITLQAWQLQERSILIGVVVWPIMAVMPLAFFIATVRHGLYAWTPELRPDDAQDRNE
ncbi:MAG: TRAP transporter small permease [Xanthomonadales bacterium]|nr:TRAP transporter small permease [Xanthomonadales bacterium]